MTLFDLAKKSEILFVKIRFENNVIEDYGPYNSSELLQLFQDEIISGLCFIYCPIMPNWKLIADFEDYEAFFGEAPPDVKGIDRRIMDRKELKVPMVVRCNGKDIQTSCIDISMMALKFKSHENIKMGNEIILKIAQSYLKEHTFRASVMRIIESESSAVARFIDLTLEQREAISRYLHQSVK
jgi:hypothetical protein